MTGGGGGPACDKRARSVRAGTAVGATFELLTPVPRKRVQQNEDGAARAAVATEYSARDCGCQGT